MDLVCNHEVLSVLSILIRAPRQTIPISANHTPHRSPTASEDGSDGSYNDKTHPLPTGKAVSR